MQLRSATSIRTNLSKRRRNKATPTTARTEWSSSSLLLIPWWRRAARVVLRLSPFRLLWSKMFLKMHGDEHCITVKLIPVALSGSLGGTASASLISIYQSGISISRRPYLLTVDVSILPLSTVTSPFLVKLASLTVLRFTTTYYRHCILDLYLTYGIPFCRRKFSQIFV